MSTKAKVGKLWYIEKPRRLRIIDFFRSHRNGLFCGEPCRLVAFETRSFCYKFSHLARSSLKPEFLISQVCSNAGTLLALRSSYLFSRQPVLNFPTALSPARWTTGRVFPLKLNVFRATEWHRAIAVMVFSSW